MGTGISRRDILKTLGVTAAAGSVLQVIPAKAAEYAHQAVQKEKAASVAGATKAGSAAQLTCYPKLSQKQHNRKHRNRENQHQPLKIVALQPACEVQNQNDDRNDIEGVERHFFSPLIGLLRSDRYRLNS